jgi:2-polyprenyl-3-methyl-5-hydroxy-6-metoxy-1,4-benzoquinol methylase
MSTAKHPEVHWTPEMVSRFWDWQSQFPETYFTFQFGAEIARSLDDLLQSRKTLLDYGCGTGYLLPHLCRPGRQVWGADISEESVRKVNQRLAGLANFKGAFSVDALRAQQQNFDAILVVEVLEHLYDDALESVLRDVHALLAPGGIAVFTTPNDENLALNHIVSPETGHVFHRWQHVRAWDKTLLPARLQQAGFAPLQVIETNLALPRSTNPRRLAKRWLKKLLFRPPARPHLVVVAADAAR